eukprot:2200306-Alexandrium_andersonii.AAC.1
MTFRCGKTHPVATMHAQQECPSRAGAQQQETATSLQAFEPGTARAQERPQKWPPELPRDPFCD